MMMMRVRPSINTPRRRREDENIRWIFFFCRLIRCPAWRITLPDRGARLLYLLLAVIFGTGGGITRPSRMTAEGGGGGGARVSGESGVASDSGWTVFQPPLLQPNTRIRQQTSHVQEPASLTGSAHRVSRSLVLFPRAALSCMHAHNAYCVKNVLQVQPRHQAVAVLLRSCA